MCLFWHKFSDQLLAEVKPFLVQTLTRVDMESDGRVLHAPTMFSFLARLDSIKLGSARNLPGSTRITALPTGMHVGLLEGGCVVCNSISITRFREQRSHREGGKGQFGGCRQVDNIIKWFLS
ncbi:hypothetical protein DCAR_0623048 [Daucus carota subsp. sativus]|uniref:Uncharacterized protein n=1 Tax=Daucus carota subsp. sativus TaxID=79200 RepID=A0AAF1B209_DAUCS|nr:PREDICTED: uncharacterized protein LOC108192813 [Daucus carota subsp. sativus]WOH03649.1 hypothetical protein DCAR_0623048 [Daucus carota subsp. sativus]